MSIKIDELTKAITTELENYRKVSTEEIKEIVKDISKETKELVESTAPRRKGKYAKSWAVKVTGETGLGMKVVVHSKNHYQLTHLLEFGHAKRGGGRTRAFPHIAKAEEKAIEQFEKRVKGVFDD